MLPMKTPPEMLEPPDRGLIEKALAGLTKFTLAQLGERIDTIQDENLARLMIWEIDHLIWLASYWHRMEEIVRGVRADGQVEHIEMEHKGRWVPLTAEAARWVMLDRYRTVRLEKEVEAWLESVSHPLHELDGAYEQHETHPDTQPAPLINEADTRPPWEAA